jgi:hypothetical protein
MASVRGAAAMTLDIKSKSQSWINEFNHKVSLLTDNP